MRDLDLENVEMGGELWGKAGGVKRGEREDLWLVCKVTRKFLNKKRVHGSGKA